MFAISLCSYEVTLNITVFGHWQGSSGLSEYYVSSWTIPTEFHRCPVMCGWAWLGCMAGISLPIAVGDIVSVHTKALLHVLSIHLTVRYFYSTFFHERTLSWSLAMMPGLLPEVWRSLFLLFLNSYYHYCWFFNLWFEFPWALPQHCSSLFCKYTLGSKLQKNCF